MCRRWTGAAFATLVWFARADIGESFPSGKRASAGERPVPVVGRIAMQPQPATRDLVLG